MPATSTFGSDVLNIQAGAVVESITTAMRQQVLERLRRRGVVVGLSGGIDSSVVATLAVLAFGATRVVGLLMPDRDSSPDSRSLASGLADDLGITTVVEDIGSILAAAGCYARQAEAIRMAFPHYVDGERFKIVMPPLLPAGRLNVAMLTVEHESGSRETARLPVQAYLQLVAATNFKQRARKMLEYYHADRLNFAVAGTPNRLEYDQGFFVKQGDGAADLKPIAHLYKTQVYELARYLGVPEAIQRRPPTTDTFPLEQTQEEFFFSVPYHVMDLCLYGANHSVPAEEVAAATGLLPEQVERVYRDIAQKRRATRYLHTPPLMVEPVPEVCA
jgi:NAD+ synthase